MALVHAAETGNVEGLRELLAKGADPNTKDSNGNTALIRAAGGGYADCVKELIRAGADLYARNYHDTPALGIAAYNGHTNCVKELIAGGINVDAKDEDGTTAIVSAASKGHAESFRALAEAGADVRVAKMAAIRNGHANVLAVLDDARGRLKSTVAASSSEKVARIVEAQYYLIAEIPTESVSGATVLHEIVDRDQKRIEEKKQAERMARPSRSGGGSSLGAWDDPFALDPCLVNREDEKKLKRLDRATKLFLALGYATSKLGVSQEMLIQLNRMFALEVVQMFRRSNRKLGTDEKLGIDMTYDQIWRSLGQSVNPTGESFARWAESCFIGKLTHENESLIRSMGTGALILVKLGMPPEDVIMFGLMFRDRTKYPISNLEKRAIIAEATEIAIPLLAQSPQFELLADFEDELMIPLNEGSNRAADLKKCDVCARVECRPGLDAYLESDLAGKLVGIRRAGAKHLAKADNLGARAYAQYHALSVGPKEQFGRWICRDCVRDYWGSIERAAVPDWTVIWP
jgi:hypothetical protein